MKLLVFGDTHGEDDFSYLEEQAHEADIIVHVGDITDFGFGMEESLSELQRLHEVTQKPILIIHGNHETSTLKHYVEKYPGLTYLHKETFEHNGLFFVAFGGGGFARDEPHVQEFFHNTYSELEDSSHIHIWIFHGPPYDMEVDYVPGWDATGSHTKRELIEQLQPHIVLCGHIHDAWGVVHEHNNTLVVNPGPEGILLDITQK